MNPNGLDAVYIGKQINEIAFVDAHFFRYILFSEQLWSNLFLAINETQKTVLSQKIYFFIIDPSEEQGPVLAYTLEC